MTDIMQKNIQTSIEGQYKELKDRSNYVKKCDFKFH